MQPLTTSLGVARVLFGATDGEPRRSLSQIGLLQTTDRLQLFVKRAEVCTNKIESANQPKLITGKIDDANPPNDVDTSEALQPHVECVVDKVGGCGEVSIEVVGKPTSDKPPHPNRPGKSRNRTDATSSPQVNGTDAIVPTTGSQDSPKEQTSAKSGRKKTRIKAKSRKTSDGTIEAEAKLKEESALEDTKYPKVVIRERANARAFASKAITPNNKMGNRMVFYADASSEDKEGIQGAGVTYKCFPGDAEDTVWSDESFGIIGTHSIDTAEMLAVSCALKIAVREAPRYTQKATIDASQKRFSVLIFTDSQTSLQSIRSYLSSDRRLSVREAFTYQQSSAEIPGLFESLEEAGAEVEFHWLPGHSGVIGNTRADRLASDAVEAARLIMPYHPVSPDGRDLEIIPVREMVRERVNMEQERERAQLKRSEPQFSDLSQRQSRTPEEILDLLDQIKSAVEGSIMNQASQMTESRGDISVDSAALDTQVIENQNPELESGESTAVELASTNSPIPDGAITVKSTEYSPETTPKRTKGKLVIADLKKPLRMVSGSIRRWRTVKKE